MASFRAKAYAIRKANAPAPFRDRKYGRRAGTNFDDYMRMRAQVFEDNYKPNYSPRYQDSLAADKAV